MHNGFRIVPKDLSSLSPLFSHPVFNARYFFIIDNRNAVRYNNPGKIGCFDFCFFTILWLRDQGKAFGICW